MDSDSVTVSEEAGLPRHAKPQWHVGTLAYTTAGLVALFCWLLWGDFAWSMKDRSVGAVVQLLLRKFHASDFLAGILLVTLPQGISMVLGPIVSYRSDRHRGPWGRRIPYLMIPTPIAALSMVGLAFSPALGHWLAGAHGEQSPEADRWVLILFGFFWTVFEIATITANTVFGAFVNDVVPRPVLGRFYGMFRALSLIAGMVFNAWLFGRASDYYVPIFLGIGLLYGVGFTLMCVKVKEGEYPPPVVDPSHAGSPLRAAQAYLRDCFSKPYYYWVFACLIVPNLAFMPINTFNLYFSQSVGMSNDTYGKLIAFYFFLSLLQTVPLGWLVDKYHQLRLSMVALALHGVAALWGGLLIHNTWTFGIAFVLTGTLSGTWYTATASLGMALMPKMKFAQYASALGIVSSLCSMALAAGMGRFLDFTNHQYRYTYLAAFFLDAAGLLVTLVVFRKFQTMGGMKEYVAPE